MRNLKKLLAVVLAVMVMFSVMATVAFADTAVSADAKACATLGMLKGAGNGVDTAYTATQPSRIQAAVLLIRLKGLEADALKATGANYADVIASWEKPYTAYLLAHPELGFKGVGDNKFDPDSKITAQQYYKVLLTVLGYVEGKDFQYADTLTFAAGKNLKAVANASPFTVDNVATATVEALKANLADGSKTLVADLVAKGAFTNDQAVSAGVVPATVALNATAAATGAKKLTVTFNQAVADTTKATFAVTRDSVAVNVTPTWAADGKSVVLVPDGKLLAGNYTVTVKGLTTSDLTLSITGVKDETASKIVINSDKIAATSSGHNGLYDGGNITYTLFNQYGEDITSSAMAPTIHWTSSWGTAQQNSNNANQVDITLGGLTYWTVGQAVSLTGVVYDQSSAGLSVSANLTVGTPAAVDSVTFDKVYAVDGSTALATDSTYANFYLLFSGKDQYGNTIDKNAANNDLYVYSSNPSVVGVRLQGTAPNTYYVLDKQGPNANQLGIQFKSVTDDNVNAQPLDGTATVSLISRSTGKTFTFNVTVAKKSTISKFTLQVPGKAVASGENGVVVPFIALDQNGKTVTDYNTLVGTMTNPTASMGPLYWAHDYVNNTAQLKYDAPSSITTDTLVTLTIVANNGSGAMSQVSFTVKPSAYPTAVDSVTSGITPNVDQGAAYTIEGDYLNIVDNYGRSYDLTGHLASTATDPVSSKMYAYEDHAYNNGLYRIVVRKDDPNDGKISLSSNITVSGVTSATQPDVNDYVISDVHGNSTVSVLAASSAIGSSIVDIVLQKSVSGVWQDVTNSSYSVTTIINKRANYGSYTLGDISTVYDVYGLPSGLTSSNYWPKVKVYGMVGSTKYLLPTSAYNIYFDNAQVSDDGSRHIVANHLGYNQDASTTTVNLTVVVTGDSSPVTLNKVLTISNSAPAAATIALDSTTSAYDNAGQVEVLAGTLNSGLKAALAPLMSVTDQYGQTLSATYLTNSGNVKVYDSNYVLNPLVAGNRTLTTGGGVVAGDAFSVTYVVDTKVFVFKVVAK